MFLDKRRPDDYMVLALKEAQKALEVQEVPVGAILVDMPTGRVIAKAHNQRELLQDPTAHAEMIAITQAASEMDDPRVTKATMYTTLEPCAMCAGAMILARIEKLYVATRDPKTGASGSVFNITGNDKLNHRVKVEYGLLEDQAKLLLQEFFRSLRKEKR